MKSYRNPAAIWKPSPNYWPDRLGHDMSQPSWIVLHTMVCCEEQAWARFQQATQQASSTYGVCLDGSLVQYVDEKDGPWTNGTNQGTGSNLDSITIEHEDCGDYNGPRTPELYRASALLVRDIAQRYSIPLDREHVIMHRECSGASTACPDSLDVDRIVHMAAGLEPLPEIPFGLAASQSGGTAVIIPCQHPSKLGRFDFFRVFQGKLGRAASVDGGVGGAEDWALQKGWVDYGNPDAPLLPQISAVWSSDGRQIVTGATADGIGHVLVLKEDGSVAQDWTELGGVDVSVAGPAVVPPHTHAVTVSGTSGAAQ